MTTVEHEDTAVSATQALAYVTAQLEVAELLRDMRFWLSVGTQSDSGGIVAWVDHESGSQAFEYPEITGYALTHFAASPYDGVELHRELETARSAAKWLAYLIDEERLAARPGWDGHAVYNFDLAMMANGLIEIGRILEEDQLVDYGIVLVSRLVEQVERHGHLPSIDPHLSLVSQRNAWSTEGFAHLVKTAQCMLNAAEQGLTLAAAAAATVMAKGMEGQQPDGRIVTHPDDEATMLHPHLYAVEGLWAYARATGDEQAMTRAYRAVEWTYWHRLPSGGFPRYVVTADGELGPEQCDVTSQFVRAALLTGFECDLTQSELRLAAAALPVIGMGKAMPYQPERGPVHRNVWCSMFAAQASHLALADRPQELNWRHLV